MSPHLFLTPAYAYMNAFILLFGIWAITCPESVDAISMVRYCTQNTIVKSEFSAVFFTNCGVARYNRVRACIFCLQFLVLHLISIIMDIVFLGIFATLSSHGKFVIDRNT